MAGHSLRMVPSCSSSCGVRPRTSNTLRQDRRQDPLRGETVRFSVSLPSHRGARNREQPRFAVLHRLGDGDAGRRPCYNGWRSLPTIHPHERAES